MCDTYLLINHFRSSTQGTKVSCESSCHAQTRQNCTWASSKLGEGEQYYSCRWTFAFPFSNTQYSPPSFKRPPLEACMDSMCDGLESNNTDLCPQDCQKGGWIKIGKMQSESLVLEMGGQVKEGLRGGIARVTSPNMSCRWKLSIIKISK